MTDKFEGIHPAGGRKLTKQSHALQTDINHIMKRYIAHGQVPSNGRPMMYGDFTSVGSYHEALNRVQQARDSFARLPAHIRDYCQNDPGRFLDLVHDPGRRGELEELGLVPSQEPPTARSSDPAAPGDPVPG